MINKVILIGNLGKDPEVRQLDNGTSVGRFSLATNESYKDKAGEWQTLTEWHNIVVWRNLAERAQRQLKKGSMVFVEGKLTTRKWQDQNGVDKYSTEIVANVFRSLDRKESSGTNGIPMPTSNDEQQISSQAASGEVKTETPTVNNKLEEDDLPF